MNKHFGSVGVCTLFLVTFAFSNQSWGQPQTLPTKKVKTVTTDNATPPPSVISGEAPAYKFKVDDSTPSTGGIQPNPIQFKYEENKKMEASNSDQLEADETSFKAYPGYPKHQLRLSLMPTQVTQKWSYEGQDYNFNSNSASAFGFSYQYVSTPQVSISLEYSRYEASVGNKTVTPYVISDSKETIDNYGIKSQFCNVLQKSYFHQVCLGADLGFENYPLLDFKNSNTLEISKVQDLVAGFHIGYNHPLFYSINLKTKLGVGIGLGTGNTGELSSVSNNAFFVTGELEKMIKENHGLSAGLEFKLRNAEVEGLRGSNKDNWKSSVTTTALKAGYIFQF